jgi:hypothetical protein
MLAQECVVFSAPHASGLTGEILNGQLADYTGSVWPNAYSGDAKRLRSVRTGDLNSGSAAEG